MANSFGSQSMYQGLLSDPKTRDLLSEKQHIKYLLQVEAELALAQGDVGVIPQDAALAIAEAARQSRPLPQELAAGMAKDGVPIPELLKHLRSDLSRDHARWVHFGATSQDIVDTATVLNARDLLTQFEQRLITLVKLLASLVRDHQGTLISGRTRTQQGAPMSLALKMARWLTPLLRQLDRLEGLKKRLYKVQLAGAVGNLSTLEDKAEPVARRLAERLELHYDGGWHTQRDSIMELGTWLGLTTTALGKMGLDWALMAQTEVGELKFSNGGGSSTLPQKSNPVSAEILQTLATNNAGLVGQLMQAGVSSHERDGGAWSLEWLVLPQLLSNTGAALMQAQVALENIKIDTDAISRNLWQSRGLIFAEMLTFKLSKHRPKDAAGKLVAEGVAQVLADSKGSFTLIDRINKLSDSHFNAQSLANELLHAGCTDAEVLSTLQRAEARVTTR